MKQIRFKSCQSTNFPTEGAYQINAVAPDVKRQEKNWFHAKVREWFGDDA